MQPLRLPRGQRRQERTASKAGSQIVQLPGSLLSECGAGRMDGLAVTTLHILPAVFTDKRHKAPRSDFGFLERFSTTSEHVESLLILVAEWNKKAATFSQLLQVGRWHLGCSSSDQNRIIRRVLPPAQRSVPEQKGHVAQADLLNSTSRAVEKRGNSLDRKYLRCEPRQERRLVARSGSDLEHFLISLELQQLKVSRVNRRLRNGLPTSNRESRVFVGAVTNTSGNEEVARRLVDCVENRKILDPLFVQQLDESAPWTSVFVL